MDKAMTIITYVTRHLMRELLAIRPLWHICLNHRFTIFSKSECNTLSSSWSLYTPELTSAFMLCIGKTESSNPERRSPTWIVERKKSTSRAVGMSYFCFLKSMQFIDSFRIKYHRIIMLPNLWWAYWFFINIEIFVLLI